MEDQHLRYLVSNQHDIKWGMTVNSVGYQSIQPGESYPPHQHPTRYLFDTRRGRILNEYQLLYITKGAGAFRSAATVCNEKIPVKEGDMFLLFPDQWHSYQPDSRTGWDEYWIGFQGQIIDHWKQEGFISADRPVFHVGLREDLAEQYRCALEFAYAKEASYQQVLCGIVGRLLSLAIFYDRNHNFASAKVDDTVMKARIIISENIMTITPEEVAGRLAMSYSKFRKVFKEYTGFPPGQYIQEIRINRAKEMLTNSSVSIKEIALELGYENQDYFFTAFRRRTGMRPSEYRGLTRGR
ncbi:MAG: AraC family transcriptional regulator [Bacteroidales bacterium]|nr:AraC family transcriptional regulator [Bacteroidales bacterium]